MKHQRKKSSGTILISLIITMPFLITITLSFLSLSVNSLGVARKDQLRTYSQLSADAGVDASLKEINLDNSWSGTSGEIELQNNGDIRNTYQVTVTDIDDDNKLLVSTGRTYWPASSATPRSTLNVSINLKAVRSGDFSIVTGVGGLTMQNSSRVLGGEVFVNGSLNMTNTASIGLSFDTVDVKVAHQDCPNPPDASYPRVCNSGENGEPISMSNQSRIYGEVRANNQITSDNMFSPGLVASSGVLPQPLPSHDRSAQVAAVSTNLSGADASCNGFETVTWPANTKITGDVTATQSCTIIIEGDVWITGNVELRNSSAMQISDLVGDREPDIMIDGSDGLDIRNSTSVTANTFGRGARFLTYWSTAACSPDCATVTGQDLYDSRAITTINIDNTISAAETIFYSRWSQVELVNSTAVGALVGQTVLLRNSGTITFGTSVGTPTVYWIIDGYRRTY